MDYPVKLELRLDWSEMDLFGHINNVSYFKFIQASRVNYWATIGLTNLHSDMQTGPMLAATSCQFRKPLFYPGKITVEACMHEIRNTSFTLRHRILNAQGELAAEAEDVIVMYNFQANEKVNFPEELLKKVEALERRSFSK